GDRLLGGGKRERPLPQSGRGGDRGADAAGALPVPRVPRRCAHGRRRDRALARAAAPRRRGVRDRVDAAAGVCGAGVAGQADRGELLTAGGRTGACALGAGLAGHEWETTTAEMRRQAEDVAAAGPDAGAGAPLERAPETLVGAESASPGEAASSDDGAETPEA